MRQNFQTRFQRIFIPIHSTARKIPEAGLRDLLAAQQDQDLPILSRARDEQDAGTRRPPVTLMPKGEGTMLRDARRQRQRANGEEGEGDAGGHPTPLTRWEDAGYPRKEEQEGYGD